MVVWQCVRGDYLDLLPLQVLALFSNQILEVERLEALQDLEVLRLGNNKINSKKVELIKL